MLFSRSTAYGIRTLVYLAVRSSDENRLGIKQIASDLGFPEPFLAKVLQNLARKQIVVSSKGPHGGFYLDEAAKQISLLQLIDRIEGLDFFDQCGLGLSECNDDKPCPIHKNYQIYKGDLYKLLSDKSINDMKDDVKQGIAFMDFGEKG